MTSIATPEYTSEFTIPAGQRGIIVVRFYDVWGDGTVNGWQQPVTPPQVMFDGNNIDLALWFSANSVSTQEPDGFNQEDYINGQSQGGFDQHSHYYQQSFDELPYDAQLIISGNYQIAGYFSVTVYLGLDGTRFQYEMLDREMISFPTNANPYIVGNPSVIFYAELDENGLRHDTLQPASHSKHSVKAEERNGELLLFRADAERSATGYSDEMASDGCSKGYLSATKEDPSNQQVLILRVKMPTTFIGSSSPDLTFSSYQCRQISVSANIESRTSVDPLLDFWTVSSQMLNQYVDNDGYAYVFFAPTSFTQQQVIDQGTAPRTPPLMIWGNYKGYLLGDPNHAIVLRYRDPASDWEGNPVNAVCYLNSAENQPVTADELGVFLPELFGDTLDNFLSGKIGAVIYDQPWPVK
ncbi:hypothetical protein [Rahnella contaminans]|uniref:hypothetical protein n=1 Tax=Rahnella contaminans TaxID=2703882 RepID=UPI003C2D60FE